MEPEGFEPSSKHGINELSTCLSMTWLSAVSMVHGYRLAAYPVNLGIGPGQTDSNPRFMSTTGSISFGERAIGWCLVPATVARIKLTYYTSVRQQERSYFRQINFWCRVYYRAKASLLCMLTHRFYMLSNPVDPLKRLFGCIVAAHNWVQSYSYNRK